jgi:uncharacterized SAM-binding protein YcdF (DUF218 family)
MSILSSDSHLKKVYDFLVQAEPESEVPQCDAIFVFGTSNGDVAKHAVSLYLKNKAPRMILSGMYGGTNIEGPSGFDSEAEYFASIAEREGVATENIIIEPKARNTYENVIFGMRACEEIGFYPKTLIVVAVPYLLRRARAYFAKNFPEVKIYGSAMPVDDAFFTPYRIQRIKGELPRLIEYAEGGYLVETIIPEDIKTAAGFL